MWNIGDADGTPWCTRMGQSSELGTTLVATAFKVSPAFFPYPPLLPRRSLPFSQHSRLLFSFFSLGRQSRALSLLLGTSPLTRFYSIKASFSSSAKVMTLLPLSSFWSFIQLFSVVLLVLVALLRGNNTFDSMFFCRPMEWQPTSLP